MNLTTTTTNGTDVVNQQQQQQQQQREEGPTKKTSVCVSSSKKGRTMVCIIATMLVTILGAVFLGLSLGQRSGAAPGARGGQDSNDDSSSSSSCTVIHRDWVRGSGGMEDQNSSIKEEEEQEATITAVLSVEQGGCLVTSEKGVSVTLTAGDDVCVEMVNTGCVTIVDSVMADDSSTCEESQLQDFGCPSSINETLLWQDLGMVLTSCSCGIPELLSNSSGSNTEHVIVEANRRVLAHGPNGDGYALFPFYSVATVPNVWDFTPICNATIVSTRMRQCDPDYDDEVVRCGEEMRDLLVGEDYWNWPCWLSGLFFDSEPELTGQDLFDKVCGD
eukprot:scaffold2123_cov96-Cylindrotheca_fusiformis.AAC.1